MIRHFIFSLLFCFCFIMPSTANIFIDADTVGAVIPAVFGQNKATSALSAYNKAVAKNSDGTISAKDLWGVCSAGGLNIEQVDGKQKCEDFVYRLLKASQIKYYAVCGTDKNSNIGDKVCVEDLFKDVRVNVTPAVGIAQEYARVKQNDNVKCSQNYRKESRDDYLQCSSIDVNKFYEFKFDTLDAWKDDNIKIGIQNSICKIHGTDYGVRVVSSNSISYGYAVNRYVYGCVDVDESKCKQIEQTAQKFGYTTKYNGDANVCEIDVKNITKAEDLKNDFTAEGVNSFYFCSNAIQVTNNISFNDAIKEYLSFQVGVPESQVQCVSGFKTYTGDGCRTKWINQKDDVVRCSIGDREIDFVFDDINEWGSTKRAGGMEGVICLANDGTFDGSSCVALNEEQCNVLKQKLASVCTDNCDEEIRWDATNQVCVLPNSTTATKWQKRQEYFLDLGIVVGAVALTLVTGGAAAGAWVIVANVGTAAVLTGAVTKELAQAEMTWGIYEPFKKKANKCILDTNNTTCAEQILKEDLQTLLSYGDHFLKEEAHALDSIFAKLIKKIPEDSQFWQDFINDKELWDCTDTGCTLKLKHQAWEYVSQIGDTMMLAGGLARAVASIGTYVQTTKALKDTGEKIVVQGGFTGKGGTEAYRVGSFNGEHLGNKWLTFDELDDLGFVGMGRMSNSQIAKSLATEMTKRGMDLSKPISVNAAKELLGISTGAAATTTQVGLSTGTLLLNALPAAGGMIAVVPGHGGSDSEFYISLVDDKSDVPVKPNKPSSGGGASVGTGGGSGGGSGSGSSGGETIEVPSEPVRQLVDLGTAEYQVAEKPTRFVPKKPKNTNMITTVAVLGTLGAGALVGGLIISNDKKSSNSNSIQPVKVDEQLDTVMTNARNVLGYVGNKPVTLVSLPTTMNNATAPIVMIDGRAVVVVLYDKHKLPFYLEDKSWEPLLGIGEEGRWFNVYPEEIGIKKIEVISGLLNKQLTPNVVMQYMTQNNSGVSFPVADKSAFSIINSEFPKGVVQKVQMSDADKRLYNDNYLLVRQSLQ